MRYLRRMMITLLLAASFPVLAQDIVKEAGITQAQENVRVLMVSGGLSDPQEFVDRLPEALSHEFGPAHPILLRVLSASGRTFYKKEDYDSAKRFFEHKVKLSTRVWPPKKKAKAALAAARYVHLAAHGLVDLSQSRYSFLAPTISKGLPSDRENGSLQSWEIIDQLSIDVDLEVLSGCVTGVCLIHASEGAMGLSRAFRVAGARPVAASLWRVDDASTAELMIRFYGHLLKDEALRRATGADPRSRADAEGGAIERDFRRRIIGRRSS